MDIVKGLVPWLAEAYPPKAKFGLDEIPDLSGKVALVTGGNGGIGKETVKVLLQKNAKVYMAARNREKAEEAIAEIKAETGKDALFLQVDVADLKSIKAASEDFVARESQLHLLVCNAGVMWAPIEQTTAQGYDLQFGTNVLGHFFLIKLLLPLLTSTAASVPKSETETGALEPEQAWKPRVLLLTSIMRHMCQKINYESLKEGNKRKAKGTYALYDQSKFGAALLARQLTRQCAGSGVISIAVAPGIIRTNLLRHANRVVAWMIDKMYMYDPSLGPLATLYAATQPLPKNAEVEGVFALPWGRLAPYQKRLEDEEAGKRLWEWCEEQVKDFC